MDIIVRTATKNEAVKIRRLVRHSGINPFGLKLALVFWEHMRQLGGGQPLIREWTGPTVSALPGYWLLLGATVAIFKRMPDKAMLALWGSLVLGIGAAWLALFKPF